MNLENKPLVKFHTLGCKLNLAETDALANEFADAGFLITSEDCADICILNTCTVTHIADRKSRHFLRLLRKMNPEAVIIATGCYAERSPHELLDLGVNIVVGNSDKMKLPEIARENLGMVSSWTKREDYPISALHVRSFVKIQDGCRDYCSYCIVPMVRQREFCVSPEDIVDIVKARISAGYKEVILTGTKIGSYHYGKENLTSLLLRILSETSIPRLHISSLQPREISDDLLDLWSNERLCRHFHVALQSGSDSVLERMGRLYSCEDYRNAIVKIRTYVPDVAVTTDIMVGFPQEDEQEFQDSYRFCRELNFANIHVFSYSPRMGTKAAGMSGQIDEKVKKRRSQQMLALSTESMREFNEHYTGQTLPVLWERYITGNRNIYSGLTNNYIRVYTNAQNNITNHIIALKLIRQYKDGLWGELLV